MDDLLLGQRDPGALLGMGRRRAFQGRRGAGEPAPQPRRVVA